MPFINILAPQSAGGYVNSDLYAGDDVTHADYLHRKTPAAKRGVISKNQDIAMTYKLPLEWLQSVKPSHCTP
jgi:hypothetical protein